MALANLNTIEFYQPPTKASLPLERIPKTSKADGLTVVGKRRFSKVPGPSDGWSALWGDDPIEVIDMNDSPPREHLSPFREPVPDLKDPEADPEDTSNGLFNIGDLDHNISEDHDDLPTVEELILNIGEMRKSERIGSSGEQQKGVLEHTFKEDCGGITTPNSRRSEKRQREPTVSDDDHSESGDVASAEPEADGGGGCSGFNSDGSTADGRDEESDTPDTQPTSVVSSGDGYSSLHKKNFHDTSTSTYPPPCLHDLLASTYGIQTCESQDRGDTGRFPSADEDREDQWDCKEAEVDDEEDKKEGTEGIGERDESDTSLLRSTRKRPLSSAEEKSRVNRRTKCRRFSSPLSSDEGTEKEDESDISNYAPSKPSTNSFPFNRP